MISDTLVTFHSPNKIRDHQLTSAFIICIYEKKFLFGYNNWRKKLEIPAGKREVNETIYQTAQRELFEETHQKAETISLLSVAELQNEKGIRRFRAIFFTRLDHLVPFKKEAADEMDYLQLFELQQLHHKNVDALDLLILKQLAHLIDNEKEWL